MSKSKAPAFMFYPADWLGSQRVSLMTLEEEGAYIRLLSYCWQHGSIPADPVKLARLIGKGASTTLAQEVATMFQPPLDSGSGTGGVLVHDKLDALKRERETFLEKSRQGGLVSAEMRRKSKQTPSNGQPPLEPPLASRLEPKGNSSSSSTSIVVERGREWPTLEDVLAYADRIGLAAWKAKDWFEEHEGSGWIDWNHRPIQKWQSVLNRVKTKWVADGSPMQPAYGKQHPKKTNDGKDSKYDW